MRTKQLLAAALTAALVATGVSVSTVFGDRGDRNERGGASKERWVLIGADGQIVQQTGGFKTVNCYQANDNCYIDAGEDVTDNGVHAEIVTANTPDAGTDGQLTGDTSAAPCFLQLVQCGPAGTDANNGGNSGVFVVTPRNSDGTAAAPGDRYPFYAFVSESEAR